MGTKKGRSPKKNGAGGRGGKGAGQTNSPPQRIGKAKNETGQEGGRADGG